MATSPHPEWLKTAVGPEPLREFNPRCIVRGPAPNGSSHRRDDRECRMGGERRLFGGCRVVWRPWLANRCERFADRNAAHRLLERVRLRAPSEITERHDPQELPRATDHGYTADLPFAHQAFDVN